MSPTSQVVFKLRRKQKAEQGVRVHVSGCARAEGYYRIDIKEKAKYLQAQRRQLQCQANLTKQEQVSLNSPPPPSLGTLIHYIITMDVDRYAPITAESTI